MEILGQTPVQTILFIVIYTITGVVPAIAAVYLLLRRANAIAPGIIYARKNWKSYTKSNLWSICIIDILIAVLYNCAIYLEPIDEYTNYMLTEIWIRPTITYGLVACFVTEVEK